ncbi:MAG: HAD hydrolase-like protein [Sphingomonadales bacterium]|nr:HAD hydrolase-like protein [Sphingomonadales bacterium]MDE2568499.1 HAD hydrolase-like protein [Sphingomonadales bacterium]
MSPLPIPRALLLDLDGTLIDSAPDLAQALNAVLAGRGLPPLDMPSVRARVGHGVGRLVESGFAAVGAPLEGEALAKAQDEMMTCYAAGLTDRTELIAGTEALIAACALRGIALACVTNKPAAMARTILRKFGVVHRMSLVLGGDGPLPRKPAPDPLLAAVAYLGVAPGEAWMVGDGMPDMQAARAAGIPAVAVLSDYGSERPDARHADVLVDSLHDVVALIERTCAAAA